LRLCSRACGVASGVEVRNTAVPDTRCGVSLNNDWRNDASGAADAVRPASSLARPSRHVVIITKMAAPSASGNHPPSSTLCMAAAKNVASTTTNAPVASRHSHSG
jgi:hypothetical protein